MYLSVRLHSHFFAFFSLCHIIIMNLYFFFFFLQNLVLTHGIQDRRHRFIFLLLSRLLFFNPCHSSGASFWIHADSCKKKTVKGRRGWSVLGSCSRATWRLCRGGPAPSVDIKSFFSTHKNTAILSYNQLNANENILMISIC